ncbi:MAG: hypothetical protein OHK0024_28110 [Thalassobaculales bacterium]
MAWTDASLIAMLVAGIGANAARRCDDARCTMVAGGPFCPLTAEDQVGTPALRRLFSYWQERRQDRAMPERTDIDPLDIPQCLPHLVLIEMTADDPPDLRYRLMGTRVARLFGRDLTGRRISALPDPHLRRLVVATVHQVLATGIPWLHRIPCAWDGVGDYERVLLPLRAGGGPPLVLLGVQACGDPTYSAAAERLL